MPFRFNKYLFLEHKSLFFFLLVKSLIDEVTRLGVGEAMRKTECGGVGSRGIVDLKVFPPAAHTPVPNQSPMCCGLTPKGSYPANQHQRAKSKRDMYSTFLCMPTLVQLKACWCWSARQASCSLQLLSVEQVLPTSCPQH